MTGALRHRNEPHTVSASASSSSKIITTTAFSKLRSKNNKLNNSSSNRNKSRSSLLTIVISIFGSVLFIYLIVLFSFVKDKNNNNNNNNNNNHKIKNDQLRRTTSVIAGNGKGGGGGGEEKYQSMALYTQKHIPIPLLELIPNLQSTKQRYQSMTKSRKKLFKAYDRKNKVQLEKKRDKTGKVVYNPITSIKKEDLTDMLGLSEKEIQTLSNITYDEAIKGRERLVDILNEAGIIDIDPIAISKLPKWTSVKKLYGDKPVVLGLERCEEFRTKFPLDDASIGPSGMFNTGTNPFAMYISENCILPNNKHDKAGGTRWQVPWGCVFSSIQFHDILFHSMLYILYDFFYLISRNVFFPFFSSTTFIHKHTRRKHMLAERRWTNTAGHDFKVNKTNVMPIVLVRDPYTWMQSMCKNGYEARWPHQYGSLCPNLAKKKLLSNGEPDMIKLNIKYKPPAEFKSLAHYWGEWYKQYLEADYPRLIVRFEDIQFHAKELIETVCQCAGAVPRNDDAIFRFVVDSAKWGAAHKSSTNMISAMVKYGSDKKRFTGMTEADFLVANEVFTPEIMELFGYEMPPSYSDYAASL